MEKHSRYVTDICDNDMQYQELHKKHSNVDCVITMHKLPKDGAVKAAWISIILKVRKQLIQEILHTFVPTSMLGWFINQSPVLNKINPSPMR